jgi:ABC-2 type transport system permease protein
MGNWWKIARVELLLTVKDKEAVIWSLIAPIAFAWFFGAITGSRTPEPVRVSIVRGENPEYVQTLFTSLLEKRGLVVTDQGHSAGIELPDSLVHRILEGRESTINIVKRGLSDREVQMLSMRLREIMFALVFRVEKDWLSEPPDSVAVSRLAEEVGGAGPIYLESRVLGTAPRRAEGAEHTLPAMIVMFLMFQLMTFFMVMWVEDVRTGKIKRIAMSPTTTRGIFVGQLASRIIWGLVQVLVIGAVGALVLGVRLELPWAYAAVLLFAYMITATSLGLMMATFFKTVEKANAVGVILSLVLGALGGCWWPLEIVSPAMRTIAMLLPTGLAMSAMGEFIAYGKEAAFPAVNLVGLLLMSAVFFPVGIRRMRRQLTG